MPLERRYRSSLADLMAVVALAALVLAWPILIGPIGALVAAVMQRRGFRRGQMLACVGLLAIAAGLAL